MNFMRRFEDYESIVNKKRVGDWLFGIKEKYTLILKFFSRVLVIFIIFLLFSLFALVSKFSYCNP